MEIMKPYGYEWVDALETDSAGALEGYVGASLNHFDEQVGMARYGER